MSRGRYYKTANDFMNAQPQNHNVDQIRPTFCFYKPNNSVEQTEFNYSNDYITNESPESIKMDMKWQTIQYANSGDPQVWGPAFWFTLHNGAARYPVKASPICAERMKGFIIGIPYMIPCEKCQDHALAHIEQNYDNLNNIVSGRQNLFNFFVDFHNYVNKRYGKPEVGYEEAYALYTGRTNVTKLTYSSNKDFKN